MDHFIETFYRKTTRRIVSVLFLVWYVVGCLFSVSSFAASYPGYVSDVKLEKAEVIKPLSLFLWTPDSSTSLKKRIFTEPLAKEFREKYELEFGEFDLSESQQNIYDKGSLRSVENEGNQESYLLSKEENERRRKFGEFMMRRLLEYHVDSFAKNDPRTRSAWELKQKLSKVEVKVGSSFKLNGKYSFSANDLELRLESPKVKLKWILQMNPGTFFSSNAEVIYQVSYKHSKKLTSKVNYFVKSNVASVGLTRYLRSNMSTTLLVGSYDYGEGRALRETKYLTGFRWNY